MSAHVLYILYSLPVFEVTLLTMLQYHFGVNIPRVYLSWMLRKLRFLLAMLLNVQAAEVSRCIRWIHTITSFTKVVKTYTERK